MKIYCDLSGIYGSVKETESVKRIDLSKIEGTNGYCSEEAQELVRAALEAYGPEGMHFLDNGNYHYLSLFWLEKIKEPFDLFVFDRHTDMQESALMPVLSCGSWVLEVLKRGSVPVNKIWLIGPPEEDFLLADEHYRSKVVPVPQEEADRLEDPSAALAGISADPYDKRLPAYISVDKDVLSETELKVNWEQGGMPAACLEKLISYICKARRVIGMDVCGEPYTGENGFSLEYEKSRSIDKKLSEIFF
jgi:arginase family enzyme